MSCPFKIGDIITPKVGRVQSNYFKLKDIKRMQVMKVNTESSSKSYLTVKLLEGKAYSEYEGLYPVGGTFTIGGDACQLETMKEPIYQVW